MVLPNHAKGTIYTQTDIFAASVLWCARMALIAVHCNGCPPYRYHAVERILPDTLRRGSVIFLRRAADCCHLSCIVEAFFMRNL